MYKFKILISAKSGLHQLRNERFYLIQKVKQTLSFVYVAQDIPFRAPAKYSTTQLEQVDSNYQQWRIQRRGRGALPPLFLDWAERPPPPPNCLRVWMTGPPFLIQGSATEQRSLKSNKRASASHRKILFKFTLHIERISQTCDQPNHENRYRG